MKRLVLPAVLFFTSFISHANPHDEIVTSIIESDYENFIKIYKQIILSDKEEASCLDLANKMISVRHDWMVKHYRTPQIGKDSTIAGACAGVAYIGGCCLVVAGMALGDKKVEEAAVCATLGLGIAIPSVYFCIKHIITAFQKPKQLLADAIRIKDALVVNL